MRPPTFHHERTLVQQGYTVIGVDEAGCGCLAGPVVAAACWLPLNSRIGLIRDSKLLSAAQRERALALLAARGAQWAVGVASVAEIERLNIRQASLLAMRRAVEGMMKMTNDECRMSNQVQNPNVELRPSLSLRHSTFDLRYSTETSAKAVIASPRSNLTRFNPLKGVRLPRRGLLAMTAARRFAEVSSLQHFVLVDAWHIPGLHLPQRGIIHGDRLVKSIAAASIVAKCARDTMMDALHREHPQYGFAKHRGYGTEQHRQAILDHGMTPHHRKLFCTHLAPLG